MKKNTHLSQNSRNSRSWPWYWLTVEGVLANRVRSRETSHVGRTENASSWGEGRFAVL